MNKVLQKFGEKEENGVALFRRVMVGQVQGHRGVQIPSLPAKSADGLEQVVSSCSECFSWPQFSSPLLHLYKTCCVPWAVFPPWCGFPVASSCMKSRQTLTQILPENLLEVEVTQLLGGGVTATIWFYSSKTKEAAGDPTAYLAWLGELSKEPGPVSVSAALLQGLMEPALLREPVIGHSSPWKVRPCLRCRTTVRAREECSVVIPVVFSVSCTAIKPPAK